MRSVKLLGLLALTVMVLTAFVGTSSSTATATFKAGGGGEQISSSFVEEYEFKITSLPTECELVGFSGTTAGASAASLTVSPSFSKCKLGLLAFSIQTNGCEFTLNAETEGEYAPLQLHGCGSGTPADKTKGIQTEVHVPGIIRCALDVPEQTIAGAVRYSNTGGSSIKVEFAADEIMADVTISQYSECPLKTGTHSGLSSLMFVGQSSLTTAAGLSYSP